MIEYNLVRTQSMFTPVYTLIARERIDLEDQGAIIDGAMNFLKNNHSTLSAALSDTDLIEKIMTAENISIDQLMSLKYILAQSGIDILINQVAQQEVDGDGIPEGMNEYSLVNNLSDGIAKVATKVVLANDASRMSEVYSKMCDIYNFFMSPLTAGYRNPLMTQVNQLKRIEDAVGVANTNITTYLNSMLEYLGKTIILITNE